MIKTIGSELNDREDFEEEINKMISEGWGLRFFNTVAGGHIAVMEKASGIGSLCTCTNVHFKLGSLYRYHGVCETCKGCILRP